PLDAVARAPGALQALVDLGQQGVAIKCGTLAAGADEPLGEFARHRRRSWSRGGDPDRHRLLRAVIDCRPDGPVILAFEGDPLLGPQPPHQQDRLAPPGPPLAEAGP